MQPFNYYYNSFWIRNENYNGNWENWTSVTHIPGDLQTPNGGESASIVDMNSDGYLDILLVEDLQGNNVVAWINNGNFTYSFYDAISTFGLPSASGFDSFDWIWGDCDTGTDQ